MSDYYLEKGRNFFARGKYRQARLCLEKASGYSANGDLGEADKILGDIYFYGLGIDADWSAALRHYSWVLSHGQGAYNFQATGQIRSPQDLRRFTAIEARLPEAIANTTKIAESGRAEAWLALSRLYWAGRRRPREAVDCFRRAGYLAQPRGPDFPPSALLMLMIQALRKERRLGPNWKNFMPPGMTGPVFFWANIWLGAGHPGRRTGKRPANISGLWWKKIWPFP